MKITLQAVSVALDVIYTNSLKNSSDQLPQTKLQKATGVGIPTYIKLRTELINRGLLQIIGNTRNQYMAWNTNKCGCNPTLVKDVYKTLYTVEVKQERHKKAPIKMQYDEIVSYLRSRNWTGTLTRVKENGIIKVVEELNI
jgi:hypothetical protein